MMAGGGARMPLHPNTDIHTVFLFLDFSPMALVWRRMVGGGGARMPLLCRALSQAACSRAEFSHMSQSLYKVSSKSSVVDPDSVNPDPDTALGF
jgi:hypothetical protein